jgi:hypothetical protein
MERLSIKSKYFLCLITFFQKPFHLRDNVGKCDTVGEATDDNIIWETRFAFWINKRIETQNT